MVVRILLRRDTTVNWQSVNPVLGDGELGIERLPDDSIKLKFGDGTTPWNQLEYNPVNNPEFTEHKQDSNAHGLNVIRGTITDLESSITNSNTGLAGIQNDVNTIKTEIIDIQTDIEDINSKLETIDVVSIRGSVDTFADLQNIDPSTLLEGSAYIVEQDENRGDITTVYAVIDNSGTKEWEFIAEFKVDLSNFYTKDEIDSKVSIINTNVQAITNASIRNDVAIQQNIISDVSMENNRIINVATPTTSNDAANKQYVDMKAGAVDYSLTEQDTGIKWIDGKIIYQKTIYSNVSVTWPVNALTLFGTVNDIIPDALSILSCTVFYRTNENENNYSTIVCTRISGGNIYIMPFHPIGNWSGNYNYFTFRYIKNS